MELLLSEMKMTVGRAGLGKLGQNFNTGRGIRLKNFLPKCILKVSSYMQLFRKKL